jgi:hypothetical protein
MNARQLRGFYIPKGVKFVGDNGFQGCHNAFFVNDPYDFLTKPDVYYFPSGFYKADGEAFDSLKYNLNKVLVFSADNIEITNSLEVGEILTIRIIGKIDKIEGANEEIISLNNVAKIILGDEEISSNEITLKVNPKLGLEEEQKPGDNGDTGENYDPEDRRCAPLHLSGSLFPDHRVPLLLDGQYCSQGHPG